MEMILLSNESHLNDHSAEFTPPFVLSIHNLFTLYSQPFHPPTIIPHDGIAAIASR